MKALSILFSFVLSASCLAQNVEVKQPAPKQSAPKVKWRFKAGAPFIGSPAVSGNIVYAGSLDSVVYAVDQSTGKELWRVKTKGPLRSGLTLDGNNVIFSGGDGAIYSVDKASGKKAWTFTTLGGILGERRYDAADYFDSQPIVSDGVVFAGSGDGRLYAIDGATGKMKWYFKAEDIIHTTPAISGERLFFGASDGFFYCLNKTNGTLIWKIKSLGHTNFPRGEMQGSPVISKNRVFIGSRDYNLYAFDETGYGHWNRQFPFGWATALTATDSVLYVGTSDDKLFLAINPASGRELWKINAKFNIFGPPAVYQRNVYFGTQMGKLFEVNRKTGETNWIFTTDGYQANRLKYFKEDDTFRDDLFGRIKTFNDYIRMLYTLGAIYSTPAITENAVFVTTTEGILYCLGK